jgi:hypothetical protein
VPSAPDLFASVPFREAKAVADWSRVASCFRADKFPNLVDGEPCSAFAEIDDRAIRIRTETISFAIHASEVFVPDVMKYRLTFNNPALNATVDAASRNILIA